MNIAQRIAANFAAIASRFAAPETRAYWTSGAGGLGWGHDTTPGSWQKGANDVQSQSVLTFSAVYACISIISGDLAKIDLELLRELPDGSYEEVDSHPIAKLLRRPNDYQTPVDWMQAFMVSALITGNVYVYVEFNGRQEPVAWHVLDPRRVAVLVDDEGNIFYQLSPQPLANLPEYEGSVTIPARYVIHHRLMTMSHPLIGVSPLYASATSAQMGVKILANSDSFFGNMSRPSGMLTAPGKISKETAIALQKHWDSEYSKGKTGRVAVAGDGLKFEALTLNAEDMQLIEQLKYSISDVARCFRVPGFMLGDMDKVTYKNSETLARAYYSGCLQYHMEAIESRLENFFGLESTPLEIEFDLDDLLRTDSDIRFDSYAKGIGAGFLTINEARENEGRAPVEGGDEPFVQMQYIPLSQAVKPKEATPPAPAPAPAPVADPPEPDDAESGDTVEDAIQIFIERMAA